MSSFSVPKQLIAEHKARLSPHQRYFVGCIYNKPPDEKVHYEDITKQTLSQDLHKLIGKPIDIDHEYLKNGDHTKVVGSIDDCVQNPEDGSAWIIFHVDNQDARRMVQDGTFRMLSLSFHPVSREYFGVALTEKGVRDNTWIVHCSHGYVNRSNPFVVPLDQRHWVHWFLQSHSLRRSVLLARLFTAMMEVESTPPAAESVASVPPPVASVPPPATAVAASSISVPIPTTKRNSTGKPLLRFIRNLRSLNLGKTPFKRNFLNSKETDTKNRLVQIFEEYKKAVSDEKEEEVPPPDEDMDSITEDELEFMEKKIQDAFQQSEPAEEPAYVKSLTEVLTGLKTVLEQNKQPMAGAPPTATTPMPTSDTVIKIVDSKGDVELDTTDKVFPQAVASRKRKEVPVTDASAEDKDEDQSGREEPSTKARKLTTDELINFQKMCLEADTPLAAQASVVAQTLTDLAAANREEANRYKAELARVHEQGIAAIKEAQNGSRPASYRAPAQEALTRLQRDTQRYNDLFSSSDIPNLSRPPPVNPMVGAVHSSQKANAAPNTRFEQLWQKCYPKVKSASQLISQYKDKNGNWVQEIPGLNAPS
jgi:hypothetical protein